MILFPLMTSWMWVEILTASWSTPPFENISRRELSCHDVRGGGQ
jgi:hypothetical protein